jgi:uncharacterized iron-regulated membrane protein
MYLQAGEMGHDLVGWVGVLLMIATLSGLYLWWPARLSRAAFLMKFRGPWARIEYEGHRLAGFYSLVIVAVVTLSGLNIVFTDQVRAVIGWFSPVAPEPEAVRSAPAAGRDPVPPSRVVARAMQEFPAARLQTFITPSGPEDVYDLVMRQEMEVFNETVAQTELWIDQYSGEVLHVRDPRTFNAGTTLDSLRYSLHNGESFGEIGKFIVFMTGPVLLWLYVTGITRWLRRRRITAERESWLDQPNDA